MLCGRLAHAQNYFRPDPTPAIYKSCVGSGQLQRRDFFGSERERRITFRSWQAKFFREVRDARQAGLQRDVNSNDVQRFHEPGAHGYVAHRIAATKVCRTISLVAVVKEIARRIGESLHWRHAIFERCGVDEWLES